jgi:hypothetical protein
VAGAGSAPAAASRPAQTTDAAISLNLFIPSAPRQPLV